MKSGTRIHFIPERLGTPVDVYDDEQEPSQSTPNTENISTSTTSDIDFHIPPSPSPKYLVNLATHLQSRHIHLQSSLKQATLSVQEAAASVFIMQARLDSERKTMRKMMDAVAELVGNWEGEGDEQSCEGEGERSEDSVSEHDADEGNEGEIELDHPDLPKSDGNFIPNDLNLAKGKENENDSISKLSPAESYVHP